MRCFHVVGVIVVAIGRHDQRRLMLPNLPAIEQLESALASYPGTLLLVTHDRRMLAAVQTNRRLRVHAGRIAEDWSVPAGRRR